MLAMYRQYGYVAQPPQGDELTRCWRDRANGRAQNAIGYQQPQRCWTKMNRESRRQLSFMETAEARKPAQITRFFRTGHWILYWRLKTANQTSLSSQRILTW